MNISQDDEKVKITSNQTTLIDTGSAWKLNDTLLDWAGEYEIGGVAVEMIETPSGHIAKFVIEDIAIVSIGSAAQDDIEAQLDLVSSADVLFVSASSPLTTKEWKNTIESIEPRVVIGFGAVQAIFTEVGALQSESVDTYALTRSKLPTDRTEFCVLS